MPRDKIRISSIQSILNNDSEILSVLCARASQISTLQRKLRIELGSPLSKHLIVANFNHKALTIHADSPAWAARLRFQIPDILRIAKETCALTELHSIRVKVVIPENEINKVKRKISLSDKSVQLIRKTAELTSDSALRSSLFRLSKHNS